MENFNKKFRVKEFLIQKVGAWNISLRPQQSTIGSLILSLSRPCISFADLAEQEAVELGQAFKVIEILYATTFKPQKINYLALMMIDSQVHYHVLPRYESNVIFDNISFKDQCWPKPFDLMLPCSEINLDSLLHFLKTSL